MYSILVHTNPRSEGNPVYAGRINAETILEAVTKLRMRYDAGSVADWIAKNVETLEGWIADDYDGTFFCGDNGTHRFDMQFEMSEVTA